MFQGMKQPAPAASQTLRDVYTVSRLNREAKAAQQQAKDNANPVARFE